jgi:hypothetical protein
MYDKFAAWMYTGSEPESDVTRDEMLDDITLCWRANTAASSAQLCWENNANNFNPVDISIPAAVTAFPGEIIVRHEAGLSVVITTSLIFHEVDRGGTRQHRLKSNEIETNAYKFKRANCYPPKLSAGRRRAAVEGTWHQASGAARAVRHLRGSGAVRAICFS